MYDELIRAKKYNDKDDHKFNELPHIIYNKMKMYVESS